MPTNSRKAKLESVLLQEIAICVQQVLKDPRIGFVTIVRVVLSDDFHECKAYYTVLGEEKKRKLAAQALLHARGFIQGRYADVVKTRMLPKLEFVYDDAELKRQTMHDLIRKARQTDTDGGSMPTPATPEPGAMSMPIPTPNPPFKPKPISKPKMTE